MGLRLRSNKVRRPFARKSSGGGSFVFVRRWLGRHSRLRGCTFLAVLAKAKIPRRSIPCNFQTGSEAQWHLIKEDCVGRRPHWKGAALCYLAGMNLLIVLLVLLLLFGGGGFYFGGPVIGGSGIGLLLVICLIVYACGGFRTKN